MVLIPAIVKKLACAVSPMPRGCTEFTRVRKFRFQIKSGVLPYRTVEKPPSAIECGKRGCPASWLRTILFPMRACRTGALGCRHDVDDATVVPCRLLTADIESAAKCFTTNRSFSQVGFVVQFFGDFARSAEFSCCSLKGNSHVNNEVPNLAGTIACNDSSSSSLDCAPRPAPDEHPPHWRAQPDLAVVPLAHPTDPCNRKSGVLLARV